MLGQVGEEILAVEPVKRRLAGLQGLVQGGPAVPVLDSNEELVGLDKLNSATIAAAKLGMGVNCFGGIDYHYLPSLAATPRLEDICMGASILKRSLLVGVNQAINEALQQILFHQRGL